MTRMALLVFVLASAGLWAQGPAPADLVLTGGRIYTLDAAKPWAEAVAIRGSRIVAVGSDADVRPFAGSDTRTIDLRGAFVAPGFNDAHVHIDSTGSLLVGVNLLEIHEAKAFTDAVAAAASRLPAGSWITRGDWGAYEQWSAGSAGAVPWRERTGRPVHAVARADRRRDAAPSGVRAALRPQHVSRELARPEGSRDHGRHAGSAGR